jgi:hypothetical protein
MGLLDDAIREHLDLKRRRGADPAEIERAEREALGPVRRKGGEASAAAESEPELGALIESDEEAHGDPAAGVPPTDEELPALHFEGEGEGEGDYDDDEPLDGDPLDDEVDDHATRVMRIPDGEPPPPAAAAPPAMSDATTEYDVEEALAGADDEPRADEPPPADEPPHAGERAEESEDDEDMLEETPEFLQDTPDHDRLWFEQRPPRDFDFDG